MQRLGCIPTDYTGWLVAPLPYNLMIPLEDGCTLNFSGALRETAARAHTKEETLLKTEAMGHQQGRTSHCWRSVPLRPSPSRWYSRRYSPEPLWPLPPEYPPRTS